MRSRSLLTATLLVSAGVAAHADTFNFSFGNPASAFSGSGSLTTGTLLAPGEYSITSVTGSAATAPSSTAQLISYILPAGTFPTVSNGGSFPANDNVLFVTNGIGSLDGSGLSFLVSNGAQINLYNPSGSVFNALLTPANGANVRENALTTITAVAPTPEPSTFALLGTGLLGILGTAKRRFA